MKKQKIYIAVIIGLVTMLLVAVMFAQFKTIEETDITGIETAREAELRTMLSSWKEKYEETAQRLTETQNTIDEYKRTIESNEASSEILDQELEQTNLLLGKTDVVGNGVIVTLTDNDAQTISADDLLVLVNELRLAGAEAISINDKRIVNMSEIVAVGDSILVNTERVTSPYVVKTIGDQTYLFSALSLKNSGFIDTHTSNGETVELVQQNNITIPAYSSSRELMSLNYAKEVEEE